ncbi:MAG: EF-Tu/IF-2/RF-3 family GTPase [Candidatus Micrarchaeia archaeon]|jgi:selenocysteine-specific translation elongation factor
MTNSIIGVFSPNEQARQHIAQMLGKKGSADDISIYNTNFGGKLVTTVEPTLYPKKVEALAFCAYLADYCIVHADALTPELGEIIVTLDLLGKANGCLIGDNVDWNMFCKGTALEKYERVQSEEDAKQKALAFEPEKKDATDLVAIIDHAFEVKGVGSVALGIIKKGILKVHDKLQAFPSDNFVEIRSIQMQDKNFEQAGQSDRFGIAFKGMKADDLGRGMVLSASCPSPNTISAELEVSKFCKKPVVDGEVMHFCCGMQMVPGKIKCEGQIAGAAKAKVTATFDRKMALPKGETILTCRLNEKGLRIVGRIPA